VSCPCIIASVGGHLYLRLDKFLPSPHLGACGGASWWAKPNAWCCLPRGNDLRRARCPPGGPD
jgi:hypothetical protein